MLSFKYTHATNKFVGFLDRFFKSTNFNVLIGIASFIILCCVVDEMSEQSVISIFFIFNGAQLSTVKRSKFPQREKTSQLSHPSKNEILIR